MLPSLPLFARDLFARNHVGVRMCLVGVVHAKSRQAQIDAVFEVLGQRERAVGNPVKKRMRDAPTVAADAAGKPSRSRARERTMWNAALAIVMSRVRHEANGFKTP